MNPRVRTSFAEFLAHARSTREVSLAIAPELETLAAMVDMATASGFTPCRDAFDIVRKLDDPAFAVFISASAELPKALYDLVAQYPTGQVQLNDPETLAPLVANPKYEGNTVVVVTTEDAVSRSQASGFDFLGATGLCWRP